MIKKQATLTAKSAVALHHLPLDAPSLHEGLILAGLMVEQGYLSTTDSGEIKSYLVFTEAGLEFGKNAFNPFHEFKTDPKFFEVNFPQAYLLAVRAILAHGVSKFGDLS
jgi:hypothetical protein